MKMQFIRPDGLQNPTPKVQELLSKLLKSIGLEQVQIQLNTILMEWAANSGYYLIVKKERFVFVHVSLNSKDYE